MQLLGILTAGTSEGGQSAPSNHQIKKRKRKVKALQKKDYKGGPKPGKWDRASDDFIPKAVLDAVCQAGGDNGGKYVTFLLSGPKRATTDNPSAKSTRSVTEESQDDNPMGDGEEEEEEAPAAASASSSFSCGSYNCHAENPNKKSWKLSSLHVISFKILKTVATPVCAPTDYTTIFRAKVDSLADTVCCRKTFWMIEQSPRVATVSGFHCDLGAVNDVPIANCCTAIDLPNLQEMLIVGCNGALYFGAGMEDSLISPNQLRANGLIVDTCPKQFSSGKSIHGIYVSDEDIFIPSQMHRCISYFALRLPTHEELATCRRMTFTSKLK
jgi:hypothetical protein